MNSPVSPLPDRRQRVHRLVHCNTNSRTEAVRLDNLGAHSLAETYFARTLAALQTDPTSDGDDCGDALNDLARCRFNGGRYELALQDYQRLLALIQVQDPEHDDCVSWIRHQIGNCSKALRDRVGIAMLQRGVDAMLKRARTQSMADETDRQQRLRALARRLIARGRMAAGARLMAAWIDQIMATRPPESDEALVDIRDHGMALWQMGDLPHAAHALRAVVVLLNHRLHDQRDSAAVIRALADWEACVRADHGAHRLSRQP